MTIAAAGTGAEGPHYKWVVVGLLFFAGFLNLEDRVVIFSVMPLVRAELQLTDFFVGALMSAFLWTYAFASPFAGYFGDRLSRKRVIVGCLDWKCVVLGMVVCVCVLCCVRYLTICILI